LKILKIKNGSRKMSTRGTRGQFHAIPYVVWYYQSDLENVNKDSLKSNGTTQVGPTKRRPKK
jgi:hypothetical protein